jgi:hypothetical protein
MVTAALRGADFRVQCGFMSDKGLFFLKQVHKLAEDCEYVAFTVNFGNYGALPSTEAFQHRSPVCFYAFVDESFTGVNHTWQLVVTPIIYETFPRSAHLWYMLTSKLKFLQI